MSPRSPARAVLLCFVAPIVCLGLALAVPGSVTWAQGEDAAGKFLESFAKRAIKELNDPALSPHVRERRFKELLREAVDIPALGRFVLARHWRRATEKEREDFLSALEDIAVQRFLPVFTKEVGPYNPNEFEVLGTRPGGTGERSLFVESRVGQREGPPAKVVWRMRKSDGTFKILDILVEGLSMAITLRDEYNSAIKRLGGVAELVEAIRQKLQEGAYAPQAKSPGQD